MRRALGGLLLVGVLMACGGDDDESTDESADESANSATATTASEDGAGTTATATNETSTTAASEEDPWQAHAVGLRQEPVGSRHEFDCPGGGEADDIWGTDIYTDDSSVCTAAVHAGFITFEDGGTVTIVLEGPQESYEASERNGVTSIEYPFWEGSFSIESAD